MSPLDREVPPAGEEIHLPGPSLQPVLLTICLTVALVGVTVSPVIAIVSGVFALAVVLRWVADTRRDVDELPVHDDH
jgi:hypothetical protein